MGLLEEARKGNLQEVKNIVEAAVRVYPVDCPEEPEVDTAYGVLPLSALDKKSKKQMVLACAIDIVQRAKNVVGNQDIEIAKLIATSPVLRTFDNSTKLPGLL